jgi:enoyl-CoA hydratase
MNTIQFEVKEKTGILRFNRPDKLNALNSEMIREITEFFQTLEISGLRALILTGAGRAFIAGADIAEMKLMSPEEAAAFAAKGHAMMNAIEDCPLPVIAAVNEFALGAGLETALSADFIYASAKAKLGLPEVTLGLIPGFGGNFRLPRRIGTGAAAELISTGRIISADDALKIGLVNAVCEPEALLDKALETAEKIQSGGPSAVIAAKAFRNAQLRDKRDEACAREIETFSALFDSVESHEGMSAFLEKRTPNWS